jgi:hypothetical protein
MKIAKTRKLIDHLQNVLTSSERTVTAIEGYSTIMELPEVMKQTLDRAYASLKHADHIVTEAFAPLWKGRRSRRLASDASPTMPAKGGISRNGGNRSGRRAPHGSIKTVVAQYEQQFPKLSNNELVNRIFPQVAEVITSPTEHKKKLSLYQTIREFRRQNPSLALRVVRKSVA